MGEGDATGRGARPRSAALLRWALAALGLVVAAFVLAHIFFRPIPPDQQAPAGHFGEPCVLCHIVTDGATPVDLP